MVKRSHNKDNKDIFARRTVFLTVFLLLFFAVIIARLFKLQVLDGNQARAVATQQHSIYQRLLPSRGEIRITDKFSQDGYPVATNIKHFLVYAVPSEIRSPQVVSQSLASVLAMDPNEILAKIVQQGKKYVAIKKNLSDTEQAQITALKLPGIFFDSEDARLYPEQTLLSQVLGFVGYKDGVSQKVGLYGLERFFQDRLAGTQGYINQEKDAGGAWIFGGNRDIVPAQDGVNLLLTIDKSIQFEAESVLKDTITKHGADSGSVIIINPKTGAILAMAGFPDFNPNTYNQVQDPRVFLNQVTTGDYEPGSTFKAITMAAAVDEGKITPDTTYTDMGFVKVDKYTIKNAEGGARGIQTMTQALDLSLNTGAIFAQNLVGNKDFLRYLQSFGFGKKIGIELPESAGDLSNIVKGNIEVNYDTASFGQGISVTPLQMVQAYSAIANGGRMMKPYIVQSKISPDGKTEKASPQVIDQVISPKTANTVAAMLVDVVENGFGKKAAVPGYYIAGKTGTAQVAGNNGKYDPTNNIGSFIGFGPVEDPQFLMIVRIDHPRDVQYAESTAAPAFGTIAKFIVNYYNIPPTRQTPAGK
jgi:cell division protein FtsI/penicillin-binding protein 2